ncbi:hypothetical protein ACE6H2_000867 [Prunus campanulata]
MATELITCRRWQAGDGRWRPTVMVASGRRRESDGGGRWREFNWAAGGEIPAWRPVARFRRGGRRRDSGDGGRRRDSGCGGWLDMDMWHSMLALEGVALCVIFIFCNGIFVTFWFLASC